MTNDYEIFESTEIKYFDQIAEIEAAGAAQLFNVLLKIGAWGVLITLIACGIGFMMFSSDSVKRRELKPWLCRIMICGVVIFGFVGVLGLVGVFMAAFE